MLPILDHLTSFQKRAMPLSVKAWHQMISQGLAPERAELIRGVIIEKMSKTILHYKLTEIVVEMIRAAFGNQFWVRQEAPLTLTDSEPEPDVSVVEGHRQNYETHPTTARLVVEVSVSTLPEDRAMADIYAEAAVAEYWIVNAVDRCIELYQQPVAGHYQSIMRVDESGVLESAALPGLRLNIGELFAGLPRVV